MGDSDAWPGWHLTCPVCHGIEQRIVVVRVFVKKTRKTPVQEIELALRRAKEIEP